MIRIAAGEPHAVRGEFLARPVGAREFVIGQAGDAPLLHAAQELGRVALAVKTRVKRCSRAARQGLGTGWPAPRAPAWDELLLDDLMRPGSTA